MVGRPNSTAVPDWLEADLDIEPSDERSKEVGGSGEVCSVEVDWRTGGHVRVIRGGGQYRIHRLGRGLGCGGVSVEDIEQIATRLQFETVAKRRNT